MIDFSKLGAKTARSSFEPRDIFMSLPTKDKQYEYPRDVQSEVWKQWSERRSQKNTIIKMNTGSGKTVVGLIILKSCLDENKGPAIYVAPDNYLVQQVCAEADKLGIRVARDENEYDFIMKRAILVINIHKLVNGKSIFGMRDINNIPIGSILIDDVHACLETIDAQFSITIPINHDAYSNFVRIFESTLKSYSEQQYVEIVESQYPASSILIPFWSWQDKILEVKTVLHKYIDEDFIKFSFPLIDDCLDTCNCVISARSIEITPKCIPIAKIAQFEQAKRRIFMSATLSDDSVFVTAMGLNQGDITNIVTPEKANDIGDRLLIFPQLINKNITEEEIKLKLKSLSKVHNVVVIVPSRQRASFWSDVFDVIVDRNNIDDAVNGMKNGHLGLVVFINKYDGVDLPDDTCRILVIDGLPNMRNEYDSFVQNVNPSSKRLLGEQIQKIEQGMGRGVRSNNDYCVAVLMGSGLADVIFRTEGLKFFSKATQVQLKLSQQLWDQLLTDNHTPQIDEIFSLADYSLNLPRNIDWIKASKDALSTLTYDIVPHIDEISIALRCAFEKAEKRQYKEAVLVIQDIKNKARDEKIKGFLMQLMAEYTNFINKEEAQQILLSAMQYNNRLIRPIEGIQHQRLIGKTSIQAQALVNFINDHALKENTYFMKMNAILESLKFSQDTSTHFEKAMYDISHMLGIVSSRPETDQGKGPDNLWVLGDNGYLVIECKNETTTDTIKKHYCNQLNGSINWFENEYRGSGFTCFPILIHHSDIFEHASSPNPKIRIMTPDYLLKFRQSVLSFAKNVVLPNNYKNVERTQELLSQFKLLGAMIVNEFTTEFKVK